MDEAGSGFPPEEEPMAGPESEKPKRKRNAAPAVPTVRRHKIENINRNNLAHVLDTYAAEGRVVIALNISRDIGGTYEVVSYKNEPVN